MGAGVASQKLAMQVSQKPAGRFLTLNEVPPKASVDCRQAPLLTASVSPVSCREHETDNQMLASGRWRAQSGPGMKTSDS